MAVRRIAICVTVITLIPMVLLSTLRVIPCNLETKRQAKTVLSLEFT